MIIARRMVDASDPDRNLLDNNWGVFARQATALLAACLFAAACSASVPVAEVKRWLAAGSSVEVTRTLSKMAGLGIEDVDSALDIVESIWSMPSPTREGIIANASRSVSELPDSSSHEAPDAA